MLRRVDPLCYACACPFFLLYAVLITAQTTALGQSSAPVPGIIYDNSGSGGNDLFSSEFEFGDEIILKPHPANRFWILTDFLFEYFGDFAPQGDEQARVRFYLNDGPPEQKYPPTTMLFDSGDFALKEGYQVGRFGGLNITLPDDEFGWTRMTWTVQFSGMRNVKGDRVSLILRPETDVGHNFKDVWINTPNGWTLSTLEPQNPNFPVDPVTNPDPIEKFGARMYGLPSAPTPPPQLRIQRRDDKLVLEWTGPARLQQSMTAAGGYTDVHGSASPYTVRIKSGLGRFWRLVN